MDQSISDAFCTHFPILAEELGASNTALFLKGVTELDLPAGRNLILYRMPLDSTFFILAGSVQVEIEENNVVTVLDQMGPGQMLGEVSALSGDYLASATVITKTTTRFLRMRHQVLEEFIDSNQEISTVLLRYLVLMLSDRLRKTYQLEASLAQINA